MRLFFIVAVVFVAVRGEESVSADDCAWGPAYWCSSIKAASSCHAFKHCLDTVWTPQLLDVQQTKLCLAGEDLVEVARRALHDENEERVTLLMTSLCKFVKDDSIQQTCENAVTHFLPEVLQLVKSSMEPTAVAALLGVCQPYEESTAEPSEILDPTSPAGLCNGCHELITDMKTLIAKPGSQDQLILVMGDIVCSELGDLKPVCKNVLETGVPRLVKLLEDAEHPEAVCGMTTYCTAAEGDPKPKWDTSYEKVVGLLTEVFSDLEVTMDETLFCNECNKVLSSALAYEKESRFRTAVEHAIGFVCSNTDLGEETCRLLSEGVIPRELIDLATEQVNVNNVCASTLSCAADDDEPEVIPDSSPEQPDLSPSTTSECSRCLQVFGDIRDLLKNTESLSDQSAVIKASLCTQEKELRSECSAMVDASMQVILEWLTGEDSPVSVCSELAVCPRPKDSQSFDLVKLVGATWDRKPLGDFKCDECQVLVQDARDADVQETMTNFVANMCARLGFKEQQCGDLLQYAPQLFEIVASEMEPTVVCDLLLRCGKPELESEEDEGAPQSLPQSVQVSLPFSQQQVVKKSKKNSAVNDVLDEVKVGDSIECGICHLSLEYLDQLLGSNRTEEALEDGLGKVCSIMPSTVKQQCVQFVNTFTPSIINMLIEQLAPQLICDELGVCNGSDIQHTYTGFDEEKFQEEVKKEEMKPEDTLECQICELVGGSVDQIVSSNRSREAIQKALDGICDTLPGSVRDKCLPFVTQYGSVVVELLLQELEPQQVCYYIGVCQQTEEESEPLVDSTADSTPTGPMCSLCELVVGEVDRLVGQNSTEPAVQTVLEQICSLFPNTISSECETFVDTYSAEIINLLLQHLKPKDVCKTLKLCSSQVRVEVKLPEADGAPTQTDCELCDVIMADVFDTIKDDRSLETLESVVSVVCDIVPVDMKQQCQSAVTGYGPDLLGILQTAHSAADVCQTVRACVLSAPSSSDSAVGQGNASD